MNKDEFFSELRKNYGFLYNEGGGHFDGYTGSRHWENHVRWMKTAETLRTYIKPRPFEFVLDIGCGRGSLVRELRALGVDAFGIDIGDDIRDDACAVANAIEMPFFNKTIHAILALDVIEHIPSDYHCFLFGEFRRVVREYVITTVPTEHPHFMWTSKSGYRNHYMSYSPEMWRARFEYFGFKIIAEGPDLVRWGPPFSYGETNYPFVLIPGGGKCS